MFACSLFSTTWAKQMSHLALVVADCEGEGSEGSGNAAGKEGCLHARYVGENPVILKNFSTDLLPLLLQIYGSTVAEKVHSSATPTYMDWCGKVCKRAVKVITDEQVDWNGFVGDMSLQNIAALEH